MRCVRGDDGKFGATQTRTDSRRAGHHQALANAPAAAARRPRGAPLPVPTRPAASIGAATEAGQTHGEAMRRQGRSATFPQHERPLPQRQRDAIFLRRSTPGAGALPASRGSTRARDAAGLYLGHPTPVQGDLLQLRRPDKRQVGRAGLPGSADLHDGMHGRDRSSHVR